MSKTVKRGYVPTDEKEFIKQIDRLKSAGEDLYYLLNKGYHIKGASTFVGNHYLLSERQRLALVRSVSAEGNILRRLAKQLKRLPEGAQVYIDGFNTIISLEIAFSRSTLLKCMDGTIRDLAGLRGTYQLIDKTDLAINAIKHVLEKSKAGGAVIFLDAPVSNSGRLKGRIEKLFSDSSVGLSVEIMNDVDVSLYGLENVITADAIILDKCESWYNLVAEAIRHEIGEYPYIEIMNDNK